MIDQCPQPRLHLVCIASWQPACTAWHRPNPLEYQSTPYPGAADRVAGSSAYMGRPKVSWAAFRGIAALAAAALAALAAAAWRAAAVSLLEPVFPGEREAWHRQGQDSRPATPPPSAAKPLAPQHPTHPPHLCRSPKAPGPQTDPARPVTQGTIQSPSVLRKSATTLTITSSIVLKKHCLSP